MNDLLLLFFALATGAGPAAGALALQRWGRGRRTARDNLLGGAIGFLLVGIAGLADAQLGLHPARLEQPQHRLVAQRALQYQKTNGLTASLWRLQMRPRAAARAGPAPFWFWLPWNVRQT